MTNSDIDSTSFLGTGWSFPPEFLLETGQIKMTTGEADIQASLKILLGTVMGERFLNPKYGLNLQGILFDPISTNLQTLLKDQIKTSLLIHEPRVNVLRLELDTTAQFEGRLVIHLDYEVRATNSRFNLVYPFYTSDGNEVRSTVDHNLR